jgi:energy-coupling factor transporter ATP-binding protein EcfA2
MNLRDKIWDWADGLEDWQNDLLRRIYESGELEEKELNEVKDNLLATLLGLDLPHDVFRLEKDQIQTAISDEDPVRIKKLSDLKNVGTVSDDGSLPFLTEGLTIIYGENGAGKSSYARVLKKACRAIKQDLEIHPNAFIESSGNGTAEIEIIKDGQSEIIHRNVNDKPDPRLNSISIYDRECAEVYTEGRVLDIPYLPSDLRAMKQMAEEQKKVQDIINREIKTLRDQIEKLQPKLDSFPKDETIYPQITALNYETDLEKLEELKGLNEDELEELESAEKEFTDSDPSKIQKVIKGLTSQKTDLERIVKRLDQIDESINKNLDQIFTDLINDINTLKESQKLLREEFSGDLPGTGNEAWKKLWNAAKDFSVNHAYPDLEYPVLEIEGEKAKCVLCQQSLNEDGVEDRLKRFEQYITDDIEKQLKEKRTQRDDLIKEADQLKLADLLTDQSRNLLEEQNPELLERVDAIETTLSRVKKQIGKALKVEKWDKEIPAISISVNKELSDLVSKFEKKIEAYKNLKDPSKREELGKKIKKLLARKELEEHFETVKTIVSKERKIKLREEAITPLNSRPITDKVSSLGSDVAEIIKDDLLKNLEVLNLAYLPFELKGRGREGEAKSEIILENQRGLSPKTILSDGEKNSVSLAYFLAEVSHSDHNGTLIFDDPVTSLDDTRREYVANIISELSKDRQVIVFTHDIYFMTKLENFAKKNDIKPDYLYVWSTSSNSGKVDGGLPFRRQSPSDMLKKPKGKLKHYKTVSEKINPDERLEVVETYYKYLRLTWEASIEKVFLGGIIQRYDYRVNVGGVARLTLTDDMKNEVSDAWSNSSDFLHFEGDLSSKPLPSIDQMQCDLDALETFIDKYKQN